jgi:large subunit ribosomal protein L24
LAVPPKLPKNYHNLPDRYVKRQTEFISWKPPVGLPNYSKDPVRWREEAYYDVERPWTKEFQEMNHPRSEQPHIFVQPFRRFPVMRGDRVEIMSGKDKGKQGIVEYIVYERNWLFVEGLNLKYNWVQKDNDHPGSVFPETMPLLYPVDVLLVDPTDKRPTEAEWRVDEDGNELRVSIRTEREIPIPAEAYQTIDYKFQSAYVEEAKDTPAAEVEKITFKPQAKTFEMDIMEKMGIKEDRVPYPMYWY